MADLDKDLEQQNSAEVEEETVETYSDEEAGVAEDTQADEAAEEDAADDTGETGEVKKKSKLFRNKKDKRDEKIEELSDRLMRQMAEFDNYRKRTDKEKSQMFESGVGLMIERILPVVDDFERGLAVAGDEEKEAPFVKGMEMIYKKFITVLEENEVVPIAAVGQEFNPDFHNAVMQSPSEEYETGTIIQELQKGYLYKEKVIRHSMVIVAE